MANARGVIQKREVMPIVPPIKWSQQQNIAKLTVQKLTVNMMDLPKIAFKMKYAGGVLPRHTIVIIAYWFIDSNFK
jgi:hypothetical protein